MKTYNVIKWVVGNKHGGFPDLGLKNVEDVGCQGGRSAEQVCQPHAPAGTNRKVTAWPIVASLSNGLLSCWPNPHAKQRSVSY